MAHLYDPQGSWNVTVVDGTTRVGLWAADGSINVVPVDGTAITGLYHKCGALNVVSNSGSVIVPRMNKCGALNVHEGPFVIGIGAQHVNTVGGSGTTWAPAASVAVNFENSKYLGTSVGNISCTRASVGYVDDLKGNWTQVSANTPRISNKGLLIEEQRTNGIRNNSMQGASVPSTVPTNWGQSQNTGLLFSVVGLGVDQGMDYIDVKLAGTTAGGTQTNLLFEGPAVIAATSGQTWTGSCFIKLIDGDFTNLTAVGILHYVVGTDGAANTETFSTNITTLVNKGFQRFVTTATLANVSTTNAKSQITISCAAPPVPINFTLRVAWPQLELGASVTSPIRTTAAAATRNFDAITLSSPPAFGASYSALAEAVCTAPITFAQNQVLLSLDDNSTSNRIQFFRNTTNGVISLADFVATVQQAAPGFVTVANQGALFKMAFALTGGAQSAAVNGGNVGTTASTIPTINTVHIGSRADLANATQLNGYLTRFALWPTTKITDTVVKQVSAG